MDKQIEEMAKLIKPIIVSSSLYCECNENKRQWAKEEIKKQQIKNATALYKAGYGDLRAFVEKLRNNLDDFKFDIMIYDSELSNLAKDIYIKQLNFIKEKIIDETLNEFLGE